MDTEQPDGLAATDDIGDRIEGTHFVEVHVGGGDTVDPSFGLGQPPEADQRELAGAGGHRGSPQERLDIAEVPGRGIRLVGDDLDLGGALAAADHLCDLQVQFARHKAFEKGGDGSGVRAGVDQCPEQHVAGDAVARVDPGQPVGGQLARDRRGLNTGQPGRSMPVAVPGLVFVIGGVFVIVGVGGGMIHCAVLRGAAICAARCPAP